MVDWEGAPMAEGRVLASVFHCAYCKRPFQDMFKCLIHARTVCKPKREPVIQPPYPAHHRPTDDWMLDSMAGQA